MIGILTFFRAPSELIRRLKKRHLLQNLPSVLDFNNGLTLYDEFQAGLFFFGILVRHDVLQ